MNKGIWKRFFVYETSLMIFSILNIIFTCISNKQLRIEIPENIRGYLFFLSIGLYFGFLVCKKEYKRVIDKIDSNQLVPKQPEC